MSPAASAGLLAGLVHHAARAKAGGVTAADLMTSPAVTIGPDDTVEHAARLMFTARSSASPWSDPVGRLVGIISRTDILAVFDRADAEIREEIMREVIAGRSEPSWYSVIVKDGVVTMEGTPETAHIGHDLVRRTWHVQGVVAVRDRLVYPVARFPPRRAPTSEDDPADARRTTAMSQSSPEPTVTVGVLKETTPGEQRVAVVPESVPVLARAGVRVLVGAGSGRGGVVSRQRLRTSRRDGRQPGRRDRRGRRAGGVGAPAPELIARLRDGQAVIGMLRPLVQPELARQLARAGVTAISLDGLPRTVSRAQSMDALTSQATVAGYKAVLVAADTFGRFFPMLITAAGTSRASVLVLGAGVAGLEAMGTAHRLGAVVTGYDIRPETREQIDSVGARFLRLASVAPAEGEGGYARALTAEEQAAQQAELAAKIGRFDIVITTAQVPGRRPPLLVTAEAVKGMQTGSVLVDLAASSLGGNVEGSVADQTVLTGNGVRIIGAGNLPAQVPTAASAAYSHNIVALLADLVRDGSLTIDPADEIQAGVVITHQGTVVHPAVAALLGSPAEGGSR